MEEIHGRLFAIQAIPRRPLYSVMTRELDLLEHLADSYYDLRSRGIPQCYREDLKHIYIDSLIERLKSSEVPLFPLHTAARRGDVNIAKTLLDIGRKQDIFEQNPRLVIPYTILNLKDYRLVKCYINIKRKLSGDRITHRSSRQWLDDKLFANEICNKLQLLKDAAKVCWNRYCNSVKCTKVSVNHINLQGETPLSLAKTRAMISFLIVRGAEKP